MAYVPRFTGRAKVHVKLAALLFALSAFPVELVHLDQGGPMRRVRVFAALRTKRKLRAIDLRDA